MAVLVTTLPVKANVSEPTRPDAIETIELLNVALLSYIFVPDKFTFFWLISIVPEVNE